MRPEDYFEILDEEAGYLESAIEAREAQYKIYEEHIQELLYRDGKALPQEELDHAAIAQMLWKLLHEFRTETILHGYQARKYRILARSRTLKIANRLSKIQDRFKR